MSTDPIAPAGTASIPNPPAKSLRQHDIDTVERFLLLMKSTPSKYGQRNHEYHYQLLGIYAKSVLRVIVEGGYLP